MELLHIQTFSDFAELNEKRKFKKNPGEKYKGKHIPSKYLTKNKEKMKKEIDEFRGTDKYKEDWDADYESGKGGKGKRHKTKKSVATKAFNKQFGE